MDQLLALYRPHLNLPTETSFTPITHDGAIVAAVYVVILPNQTKLILKICDRHHIEREIYCLNKLAGQIPVPQIIQTILLPAQGTGAILITRLPGEIIQSGEFTERLAYAAGIILAKIHQHRMTGYGELTALADLASDPAPDFKLRFERGLQECTNHLPAALLTACQNYYAQQAHLLETIDGPRLTHRDFRPGNLLAIDNKLTGVIDWSAARASFAEDDLCTLEHGEWDLYPASRLPFLTGYATIRPVPEYNAIMPLLRLRHTLNVLGFFARRGTENSVGADWYRYNRQFLDQFFKK